MLKKTGGKINRPYSMLLNLEDYGLILRHRIAMRGARAARTMKKWAKLIVAVLCCSLTLRAGAESSSIQEITITTSTREHPAVTFDYVLPGKKPCLGFLLLVPGVNGSGRQFLEAKSGWRSFAEDHGLILISPSFKMDETEIRAHKGYYYPDQWSGAATVEALDKLAALTGTSHPKIYLFGFSAGAHFVHRFALWRPEKVRAFVAYSAAWWDRPTEALRGLPALIMCGEDDVRYAATLGFFRGGQELKLPWIWRSYRDSGHVMTADVVRMAQAFLAHYVDDDKDEIFVGDLQSYRFFPEASAAAAALPKETRVLLPSRNIAEAWSRESKP